MSDATQIDTPLPLPAGNARAVWLEKQSAEVQRAHASAALPFTLQPMEVQGVLAAVDRGTPRSIACALYGVDPVAWDLEITVVENHVESRICVRLLTRFEVGGDQRALEAWQERVDKHRKAGAARQGYDHLGIRDLFADDPVALAYFAAAEHRHLAMLRGMQGMPGQPGYGDAIIPVDSMHADPGPEGTP